MVRVAIVGMGFMGCTHLKAYQRIPDAEVTVIADRNPKKAAGDFSGTWGNIGDGPPPTLDMTKVTGTTDLKAALHRDDVDVVDLCLITPMHMEFATEALAAGKHVICEKPLAATAAEAQRIVDAAEQAEGLFMPAMCMRFWPQWAWLKEAVQSGRYGKVQGATFRRVTAMPGGWFRDGRLSGGGAMDLHIHDTDFVHYLFGPPKAVTSRGYAKATGCIDHLATLYHYDDVPLVQAEGSFAMAEGFGFQMRYTVNFERATADFDLARDEPLRLTHEGRTEPVACDGPNLDGWEGQLRYFIDCVKRRERPTVVDGPAALASMRTVEAECRSIERGATVAL